MSTIEEWERHCPYCRQPITLKWKNGPMPSEALCLVFDQVFHDKCWDKYRADHIGKRALPPKQRSMNELVSTRRAVGSSG
jgi:hypothetical protein